MKRLLVLACLIGSAGCALMPQPGPRPTVGPPYIPPPEPVWVVIDPALFAAPDSSAPAVAEARPTASPDSQPAMPSPAVRPPGPDIHEPSPPTPERGLVAAGAPADQADSVRAVEARAALVSFDLDPEDRARLTHAARRNLSAADSLARLATAHASSPREASRLATVKGLIRQAQEAMQKGDIRAAANLAYKARLLAHEASR